MMDTCLIKANGLNKIYQLSAEDIGALKCVDLEIQRGEFVAIMGPSGSGKTTLLDVLGCLNYVSGGHLKVLGHDVSKVKEKNLVKIRRKNIGFVFQDFLLIPTLTAIENVELSLSFARMKSDRKEIIKLLEKLGLGKRINHLPSQLSGGERQRVAIARALVTSPDLLLADEPTGNLDTKTAMEIMHIFKNLNEEDGLTIIFVTHNITLGMQAKRIIYLKDGRIVSREESDLLF